MDASSFTPAVPAAPATPVADQSGFGNAAAKNAAADAKAPDLKAAASGQSDDKGIVTDPAHSKEVKAAVEKIKLKTGEFTIEELEALAEKSKGADKKLFEAQKAKKEAIRFFKMAKENPREFLTKTGLDPKKFAYDEVAEDLKNKLRDPKEVELEQAQKRLKEYEAKETEAKKKADDAKLAHEAKAFEQKLHAEMIDALESFPELPKNGFTVAALARAIDTVREKTGVLLSAKEVAPKVVQDLRNQIMGVVKGASAEQLLQLIGEEGMKAIRAHDIAKLKNPMAGHPVNPDGTPKEKPNNKKMRSHDFWKDF
jgi:hypothetical protein